VPVLKKKLAFSAKFLLSRKSLIIYLVGTRGLILGNRYGNMRITNNSKTYYICNELKKVFCFSSLLNESLRIAQFIPYLYKGLNWKVTSLRPGTILNGMPLRHITLLRFDQEKKLFGMRSGS